MDQLQELLRSDKTTIVDVRTPGEFIGGHVAGSINIPLSDVPARLDEFRKMENIVLCCASGGRSGQVTMFLQQKLNPAPPDPIQASLFNWMPVIFTFMLGTFPAGLVIYWAWSNTLSILQQSYIMKRHGVEIDFFGNIRESLPFLKKKSAS